MIRRGPSGDQPPMPHHDFPANFRLHKTSFPRATAEVGTPLFIGVMEICGDHSFASLHNVDRTSRARTCTLSNSTFRSASDWTSESFVLYADFQLSDSPYENYFVSTCNFAATVVGLSPAPDSNLTLISPRLIAAFPAGMPRCSEETLTI
jgi:hypothetical protein